MGEIFASKFEVNIEDQKYWFQYKYRSDSISYIFVKDFISALGMLVLF